MTKLLPAALIATTTSAYAFENEKLPPIEQYTSLECVPETLKPKDNDPDPVYKIMVSLTLRSYNDPESLNVIHVRTSGEQVDRTEQYGNAKLWQKQGFNEWYWTGTLKRNPRLTMNGRLYRSAAGKWFYEETLFDRRRQDFFLKSVCHVPEDTPGE